VKIQMRQFHCLPPKNGRAIRQVGQEAAENSAIPVVGAVKQSFGLNLFYL
jgi:hypothetical protein